MELHKNPEKFRKIKEALEKGIEQWKIAKKYKTTQAYVSKAKKFYNIATPKLRRPKTNLTGKTIGYWLVQSINHSKLPYKKQSLRYNCKCLKCGTLHLVLAEHLLNNKTRKCKNCQRIGQYKGWEQLSGIFWTKLRHSAKRRKLKFDIDLEYIWNLYLEQDKKCILTGEALILDRCYPKQTASLDRIDSSKGYIKGNIQWVSRMVNKMKQNFNEEEFIKKCGEIYNYNQNKNIEYFI